LSQNDYYVCEKTDGTRYALVCLTVGGKKITSLINRALEVKILTLNVPKNVHLGTVLDGELIENYFHVYDCIHYAGESTKSRTLLERLDKVNTFVSGTMKLKKDPIILKTKNFYHIRNIKDFKRDVLDTLDHKSDGLIFTPVDSPIITGTHETMFKWKPGDSNTVDFKLKFTNGRWCMYLQEKGYMYYESEIPKNKEIPTWLKDDMIVECKYMVHETPLWWKPLLPRTDKVHPNNRRTYYNTIKNIQENITLYELICTLQRNDTQQVEHSHMVD
jgi:hypothetical protein